MKIDPKGGWIGEKTVSLKYAVIFEQAERNWAAYVPDLPDWCHNRQHIEGHPKTIREFNDPKRWPDMTGA